LRSNQREIAVSSPLRKRSTATRNPARRRSSQTRRRRTTAAMTACTGPSVNSMFAIAMRTPAPVSIRYIAPSERPATIPMKMRNLMSDQSIVRP
jgi:hypothetical protein